MFTLPFIGCDALNPLLAYLRTTNSAEHPSYCFCYNCLNKVELKEYNKQHQPERKDKGV